MKANRLAWVVLLLLLGNGCERQPASRNSTNLVVTNAVRTNSGPWLNYQVSAPGRTNEKGTNVPIFDPTKPYVIVGENQPIGKKGFDLSTAKPVEPQSIAEIRAKAEKGDAQAQLDLAAAFLSGNGVAKDSTEAVKWFRKAADQAYATAQFNLGVCYSSGLGVAMDDVEAFKWFRKAAYQNVLFAQYNVAFCYFSGTGVAKA